MQKKRKTKLFLLIPLALLVVLAILVVVNLPKPVESHNSSFNLNQIPDGTYTGKYDNGLVSATVEVAVQSHQIINVNILEHRTGMGSDAEQIVEAVVSQQSVEVDTVANATLSSKTILKAIENALTQQQGA